MLALALIRMTQSLNPDTYLFLNGGAVSWSSSKQSVVAASSTEAKYIAASEAAQEGVWMKEFISDLGVVPSALDPMDYLL